MLPSRTCVGYRKRRNDRACIHNSRSALVHTNDYVAMVRHRRLIHHLSIGSEIHSCFPRSDLTVLKISALGMTAAVILANVDYGWDRHIVRHCVSISLLDYTLTLL